MSEKSNTVIAAGFWRFLEWGFDAQQTLAFIEQCLEAGVSLFDHAAVYRSETGFGDALALKPSLREDITIITKCGIRPADAAAFGALAAPSTAHYDSSYQHILWSVEQSLRALRTDYLDVLLIHRPDYLMDVDELGLAIEALQSKGIVKSFGVSNFSKSQFALLKERLGGMIDWHQLECSCLNNQALDDGRLDQLQQHQVGAMYWSPLAGGALFKNEALVKRIKAIAERYDIEAEAMPYAWLNTLQCPAVTIAGTSKLARISHAVAGSQVTLSRDDWYAILEAARGDSVP